MIKEYLDRDTLMIITEEKKESFSENFETQNKSEFTKDLASFFDLLARFDYEDKQKEKSVLKTGPLVSAPSGPVLGSDI